MCRVTITLIRPFATIGVAVLLTMAASTKVEAMECYQCHGTQNPPDYRPLDSTTRNGATGGFRGNHRTHMPGNATPGSCAACHTGSNAYESSHRNGMVEISTGINGSPLPAVYRNGSSAFPQTTAPRLGNCTNINCHFERETPVWGSSPLIATEGCAVCHGSPPHGGVTGPEGSHGTHDLYYPGPGGCARCHSNHSAEAAPFAHASSAGHRPLSVRIQNIYTSVKASYSGPLDDYLPQSQNNLFGNCTNVYCHSTGTSRNTFAPNFTPTWGNTLPSDCSGCHGGDYRSGIEIATGSHTIHMGRDYYGQYIYDCSTCHNATTSNSRTIGGRDNHANGAIDVVMQPNFGGTYSATGHAPGEAAGTCQNVYCHSNVQPEGGVGGPTSYKTPVWGASNSVNCGGCHVGDGGHGHGGSKMATGSHTRHLAYAFTTTGNTVKCMICHKYTDQPFQTSCFSSSYGNTVCHWGTGDKHANGKVDVRLDPTFGNMSAYQGAPAPGNGYSNCLNTYCHSSGSSVATGEIPPSATTAWGSGTLACDACHGNPPAYPSGTPKANTHAKHAVFTCSRCHNGTTSTGTTITNATLHVNKSFDISGPAATPITYAYSPTGGTCTANICHNDGTAVATGTTVLTSATWGTSTGCTSCHGYPPQYVTGSPKANSHSNHKAGCKACHAATTADGTTITDATKHGNAAYDVQPDQGISFTYTGSPSGGTCATISCHGGGNATWGTTLSCDSCHGAPPATPSHLVHFSGTTEQAAYGDTKAAQDYTPNATGYIMNCGNCHPQDTSKHGNGVVEVELYNPNSPAGTLKAFNPATATYINGTTIHLDNKGFPYTNGTCSNVYCHSYNEFTTPVDCIANNEASSRACDSYATANLTVTRKYKSATWNSSLPPHCSGCHANSPRTTYATNDGMTGDSHAWGNPWDYEQGHFNKEWFDMNPITCNYCHNDTVKEDSKWWRTPSPYYTMFSSTRIANFSKHVNGRNDVAFEKTKPFTMVHAGWISGTVSIDFNLTNASYTPETKTCTNVSCHLGQTSVKWGKPYRGYKAWYGIDYVCWECHTSGY